MKFSNDIPYEEMCIQRVERMIENARELKGLSTEEMFKVFLDLNPQSETKGKMAKGLYLLEKGCGITRNEMEFTLEHIASLALNRWIKNENPI